MKNYLLFTAICFVMGCGSDKKVEFYEEKNYGNVREIHTTIYNRENINDNNIKSRLLDSFDIKGNIVKRVAYIYDIEWDENNMAKWDENNHIIKKLQLRKTLFYKYDSKFGLTKIEVLDKSGKIEGVMEFTKLDNNTISTLQFGLDRKYELRGNIIVDDENIILTESYFNRDSVLVIKNKFNRLEGKLNDKLVIDGNGRNKIYYKYISFDKEGNYTKRKENSDIVVRDIFYYNN
jgi:hypothetical protein